MEPLSKAKIKFIQSLQHKKFRLKYNKFIVEGLKINKELITERKEIVQEIYVSNPDYLAILQNIINPELLSVITPVQMRQLSQMTTPPGVLSVCEMPVPYELPEDTKGMRMFYLDAIRDPGNVGTILRIADWFGLDAVICSPDCVDIFNHKVLQSSMGSALRIPSCEITTGELMMRVRQNLYVSDMSGKNIYSLKPPAEGIIVLGNESLGVSADLEHSVTSFIAVPGDHSKGAESLNVASAAAVIAAWWTFQRQP